LAEFFSEVGNDAVAIERARSRWVLGATSPGSPPAAPHLCRSAGSVAAPPMSFTNLVEGPSPQR
jgi:hypothetical protein